MNISESERLVKNRWILMVAIIVGCCVAMPMAVAADEPIPSPGMVTMVDLGAHKCIPCKMMAPIIAELQKEYTGRASIIFIDVWENRDQAQRFGIRGIPTQIFFDAEGKEVSRHLGFLDKPSIVKTLDQLGVPQKP